MALQITPGPLPVDGTRIRTEETLAAFILGTQIKNFGPENFDQNSMTFVISQTEPPAQPTRTTLWFARGEGKLYRWLPLPTPTNPYFDRSDQPAVFPDEGRWLSLSDRRDMIVHAEVNFGRGDVIKLTTQASNFKAVPAGQEVYILSMEASSVTNHVANFTSTYFVDPVMVSQTDAAFNTFQAVPEWGFVDCKVVGFGAGLPLFVGDFGRQYRGAATHSTAATTTNAIFAILCQSDTSEAERTVQVFLRPSLTNLVHKIAT